MWGLTLVWCINKDFMIDKIQSIYSVFYSCILFQSLLSREWFAVRDFECECAIWFQHDEEPIYLYYINYETRLLYFVIPISGFSIELLLSITLCYLVICHIFYVKGIGIFLFVHLSCLWKNFLDFMLHHYYCSSFFLFP